MKKYMILSLFGFWILTLACLPARQACGFGGPAPQSGGGGLSVYMIDDFEDGDYTSNPEWWKFDNVSPKIANNSDYQNGDPVCLGAIKKYSLNISGTCTDWYCGGIGTYTARKGVDFSRYNTFQADVHGNGAGSGTMKIELNDDDNGNWQIEQDPKKAFANIYDDKFIYNLTIDWRGWKRVSIPIADFADENPGVGDDIWNPNQDGGSGGLIQIQLISIGPKRAANVRYNIDNIGLTIK